MNERYFKVLAKCGHVGKNKYITKWFYVKAYSSKEAAGKVKLMPRVKHNHKEVILQVIEIEFNKYIQGLKLNSNDNYFKIKNSSDQKIYNYFNFDQIYDEIYEDTKEEKDNNKQLLKYKIIEKEGRKIIQGGLYD